MRALPTRIQSGSRPPSSGVFLVTLSWLATMNIVLAVFNLLPGSPSTAAACCTVWCGG